MFLFQEALTDQILTHPKKNELEFWRLELRELQDVRIAAAPRATSVQCTICISEKLDLYDREPASNVLSVR